MDVSPTAPVGASTQTPQSDVAVAAQVLVLKKSMDIKATEVMSLLQGLPGNFPLATSGNLGRQVNAMV
jgi:hypothetical protein